MLEGNSDEMLARVLLGGWVGENERGLMRTNYFRKGSAEELEARQAIARYLLANRTFPEAFRASLAECFDPDCTPFPVARRLDFTKASVGRAANGLANSQIAREVWDHVAAGCPVGAAIAKVTDKYGFNDTSTVKKIWDRYRPVLTKIWGKPGAKK